jgi:CubicO group peptidase (beta-lactamase class C family)
MKRLSRLLVLLLSLSLLLPVTLVAQQTAVTKPAASATDLSAPLAAIEKALDDKRKELGIPGMSLVIVKDDQIIYLKGLGLKDINHDRPVTPDTRFAIGSATKAFTAMLAAMSVDEGKMSLEDSPKKFLPYFTLRDPDAAAKITIRDLLCHRSGLNRTDLAMVSGLVNREELIKIAGMAKPTAKLGEKFQYQNVMYAAAGEAVAKAQTSTWEKLIAQRIFKPLGMKNSDTSSLAMEKAHDYSLGYEYNPVTKHIRQLPQREIAAAAPAGAINSSARDMAQWVRFMLNNGTINGKRLVSEKNFNELVTKQMNVGGSIDYGLGWFLRQWNGHKVVEHGGNIDGFNSQVAFMPDQKLGFVLLTNVTASPLGAFAMSTIWKNIVGEPKNDTAGSSTAAAPASDPKAEVGKYLLAAAGVSFEITLKDDKLTLVVPGQPAYTLQNIGGRRYKFADPAPPGFFATFRPVKDKANETELFLEQPQGNVVLEKIAAGAAAGDKAQAQPIAIEDLLTKMIAAYGGEENLLKHKSSITTIEMDLENQGVLAKGTIKARAPNMTASDLTFTALDKQIGSVRSYFDGNGGSEIISFASTEPYNGKRLEDLKAEADFYNVLNWTKNYQITFKRMGKVGDEDVYIIEKKREKGTSTVDYISTKSFLVLRRDSVIPNETSGIELPQTEMFSDYRNVEGVMIPFKQVSNNIANGDIVVRVIDVKFDMEIPDSVFHGPVLH